MVQVSLWICLLSLSFFNGYDGTEPVNSDLTKWSSRKFCTQVHRNVKSTWIWSTCIRTRTNDVRQCRVKSNRFILHNVCKITISIRAKVLNVGAIRDNMLYVKAIRYVNGIKNKTTIGVITSKDHDDGKLKNYTWNFITKPQERNLSLSFEDRYTGFCGEVRHLSLELHSCKDKEIRKHSSELQTTINSSQELLNKMTTPLINAKAPNFTLNHQMKQTEFNSSHKGFSRMTTPFTNTKTPRFNMKHQIEIVIKNSTLGLSSGEVRSPGTRRLSKKNVLNDENFLYYSCKPGYQSNIYDTENFNTNISKNNTNNRYNSNNKNNNNSTKNKNNSTSYSKINCTPCPINTFKKNNGNEPCRRCGKNSDTNKYNTLCTCLKNFFRISAYEHDSEATCYSTNPGPINTKLINNSSVAFSWMVPEKELSIGPLTYRIDCVNCRLEQYFKSKTVLQNTTIKMLESNTVYNFKFSVSYNNVSGIERNIHMSNLLIYIPVDEIADDWTFIAVISFIVPIIITAAVVIMLSYDKQKKKNVYFQQKLTSLRRKARPPPAPPLTGTYRIQHCHSTHIEDCESDEMTSTIKPYAVLNFKSNSSNTHKVAEETDTETNSLLKSSPEFPTEEVELVMSQREENSMEYEEHLSPLPSPEQEGEQYVSMAANNKTNEKKGLNRMSSQRIQNDYIIRPFPVDLNKRFHQMPPLRSRTRSCNIGSQSFLDRSVMEMVNNDRNRYTQSPMGNRAGSCYLNTRHQNHNSPRELSYNRRGGSHHGLHHGSHHGLHHDSHHGLHHSSHHGIHSNSNHGSSHFHQAPWTRTNSYYNQNGAWNNSACFNGPTILPRKSYDNHSYFDEMEHFEEQQYMLNNNWPEAIQGRPRTRSCLVNETRNYYRYDFERNKYQPDFPPFEEMESRSRTESFYTNDQVDMFQAPRVLETPKNHFDPMIERRGRSRTFCAPEEPTIDKLSILEQAKLKTKYKRAESKEKLCATDYVKLQRPHSADDVNIVHGMEL